MSSTHYLKKLDVHISILYGKRQTRTKTPSPIQTVDAPEELDRPCTFEVTRKVATFARPCGATMKAHLENTSRSKSSVSIGHYLFTAMEIVEALGNVLA